MACPGQRAGTLLHGVSGGRDFRTVRERSLGKRGVQTRARQPGGLLRCSIACGLLLSCLSGALLFILTVVSAYVPTLIAWPHALTRPEAIGLVAAGVVYVIVDMYGGRLVQRSAAVAYFAIQIPLGAAIIYMSHSIGWIGL